LSSAGLAEIARLARLAGAAPIAAEAEAVARRVLEGRFHVACVGQFKRGKSSLINALVRSEVLPAGVLPVTSVVTVVRHGPRPAARVLLAEGWREIPPDAIAGYVAEQGNPDNVKGVQNVEVFVPSPLLATGMCLVDTPGLGSVFVAGSVATRSFVPQIDAALFIVGTDPPISGEELELLADITRQTSNILIVLNKADRVPEADRREAARFTSEMIERRLGWPAVKVYEVSAAEQMREPGRSFVDWQALVTDLTSLAETRGAALLRGAEERGTALLTVRLQREIGDQLHALERPLEETAERLRQIELSLAEAERSVEDLGPLLTAEQERFRSVLSMERERFLATAVPEALCALVGACPGEDPGGLPLGSRLAEAARSIARQRLDSWQATAQPTAERLYRALAARFVDLANRLLTDLERLPGLESLPLELLPEAGFRTLSGFVFNELLPLAEPSFGVALVNRTGGGRKAALRHAEQYLRRLLDTNSARVVNDLQERVLQSQRRLEAEIRSRLTDLAAAARRAFDRAKRARAEGADRVLSEIDRLRRLQTEVEQIAVNAIRRD
jgi:GTP-binding protein EngB required for normal cell division